MKATIVNFRSSRHRQTGNQIVIVVEGVDTKEKASGLVGKTVVWTAPGKNKKELKGKISAVHGSKGAVRAIMETGMPGQSVGKEIKIE